MEQTDYGRGQIATEEAFNELVKQAKALGLDVSAVMGLVYLPTEQLTRDFQQACRAILLALTPPASHIRDQDGKEAWAGTDVS